MALIHVDGRDQEPSALAAPARALSGRIGNLDSLRGIAATGVLLSHVSFATGAIGLAFWGGWLSRLEAFVNFFFVLSGFVLFRPWATARVAGTRRPSIQTHFVRRLLRIVPTYWVLVIVCFLFVTDGIPDALTWLRHLTFTQFYPSGPLLEGVGPAWTLTVEMAFYVILPFAAIGVLGRRWRPARTAAILCLVGAAVSLGWLSQIRPGRLSVYIHPIWFPSYAICFAVGMAMATASVALSSGTAPRCWVVLGHIGSAPWACWVVAIGLLGISTTPAAGPLGGIGLPTTGEFITRQLLYLGFAVCLLLPVVFGERTSLDRVLSHPWLRWLGSVSLGLFLWHVTVIDILAVVLGRPLWGGDTLFVLAVTMTGGLGLASLSYYAIERPAQRLAKRFSPRTTAAKGAVANRDTHGEPHAGDGEKAGDLRPDLAVRAVNG